MADVCLPFSLLPYQNQANTQHRAPGSAISISLGSWLGSRAGSNRTRLTTAPLLSCRHSAAQPCPTPCDPVDRSTPGLPVHHQSRSPPKPMCMESVMPSSHLILCRPLLLLPSVPPASRSSESALHSKWTKAWSFSFSISPSNEYL